MRVKFHSLVIQDFKAFLGTHSLALSGTGVVYIIGENRTTARLDGNGASKSSIWDALCWCLYGKTPRGLRNPDVVPWSGGKPCVTVALDIDEREYVIQRGIGRFTINDKTAPDISDILPVSFDLFVNVILLPQNEKLFLEKGPSEKMELLTETLMLDRWDARSAAANVEVGNIEADIAKLLREKTACKSALEEVQSMLTDARAQSKSWNDDNAGRVNTSKGKIDALQKRLESEERKLATAILAEDGALTEKRASEIAARGLRDDIADLRGSQAGLEDRVVVLSEQVAAAEEKLVEMATAKSCPVCGQPVKATNLTEHKKELVKLVAAGKIALKNRRAMITTGKASLASLQGSLKQVDQDIERFTQKANDAADDGIRAKTAVLELQSDLRAAQAIRQEVNPYLAQVASLKLRQEEITGELVEVEEDERQAQERLARVKPWVKYFKDIKLQLIEEVLEELEFTANSMIEEVGLEDWQIRFDIEKESKSGNVQRKIDVQISSPESKGFVKWESWSGGEGQRLKLIGSLSLADVLLAHAGIETNLEILDEPAVYWSNQGVAELCAFLANRAKEQSKAIFYIEHQAVESSHFSDVIAVIKDGDGARIESR